MTILEFPSEPAASPEAEAALLGAVMLLDASQATIALTDIVGDDFADEANRLTFHAIRSVLERGEPADPLAVLCQLRRTGRVSSWPTPAGNLGNYLHDLVAMVPVPLGYAVARLGVLETAARRRVHHAALRLGQAAGSAPVGGLTHLVTREASAVTAMVARIPEASR